MGRQGRAGLYLGPFTRPTTGLSCEVARWRDIDDTSFVLYFSRDGLGLHLSIEQLDNGAGAGSHARPCPGSRPAVCYRVGIPLERTLSRDDESATSKTLLLHEPGVATEAPAPDLRYRPLGEIGRGSMGAVERVHDRVLNREVVRKVLHEELVPSEVERFLGEAQITARLQHPGIIPVHDLGHTEDGRPCYTMEEVAGRTLEEALADPQEEDDPALRLRRTVDAMRRVAETVAYAHSRGIIHRDLKPANIMLGPYGEVRVLDWGLARMQASGSDQGGATISLGAQSTQHGDVLGTPAYMPPEQAQGDNERVGPWSDVYALGATLYHLLLGVPPYTGSAWQVLVRVVSRPPPPLIALAAERGRLAPPELVALVEQAMARDPRERPTATALAQGLGDWLDGARRRESALKLVEQADALVAVVEERRAAAAGLRAQAEQVLSALQRWEPEELRHAAWAMQDEAEALSAAALRDELARARLLHSALETCPRLVEADTRLATIYRAEHAEAEARRDATSAARFEALLRAHDRGEHAAWLSGDGALTLLTDPPGAEALLYREEERNRRLVPVLVGSLGRTPLIGVVLPRGSYRLRLRHPERAEVCYPVSLERGARWDGVPPGASAPLPVLLPRALGPDDRYVPPGWFWSGGDADAVDGLPRVRRWVDGFVIRRFPITNAEFLDFLNDLVERGQTALAAEHAPCLTTFEGGEPRCVYARDRDGRYALPAVLDEHVGGPGWPVIRVSWWGARAYAVWLAERSGLPFRLLHDQEWEKAARGVDGRAFPWGDAFDATRVQMVVSSAGPPSAAPVDSHPLDESLYGVRGCAGNVRDWCANAYLRGGPPGPRVDLEPVEEGAPYRMVRGGAWASEERFCRLASRFADPPERRTAAVSFRVGYGVTADGVYVGSIQS